MLKCVECSWTGTKAAYFDGEFGLVCPCCDGLVVEIPAPFYIEDDGAFVRAPSRRVYEKIPEGAYAALGINGTPPGQVFIQLLQKGGTTLCPLMHEDGTIVLTDPRRAGKTLQRGRWVA